MILRVPWLVSASLQPLLSSAQGLLLCVLVRLLLFSYGQQSLVTLLEDDFIITNHLCRDPIFPNKVTFRGSGGTCVLGGDIMQSTTFPHPNIAGLSCLKKKNVLFGENKNSFNPSVRNEDRW